MKILKHSLFWAGIVFVLTLIFGNRFGNYAQPFYLAVMLLPIVAGTSYFFNHYLVPNFLLKKKTLQFVLYFFYTLVVSIYLEMLLITLAFILLANYQYKNMIPVTQDLMMLLLTLYCIVFFYGFGLLVKRVIANQTVIQDLKSETEKKNSEFLLVRADRKTNKINHSEIEYLESLGDYVKIWIANQAPILTKEKISKLAEKLPTTFLRIHRSYIVNQDKICVFNKEHLQLGDTQLPISRTYKKAVMEALHHKEMVKS